MFGDAYLSSQKDEMEDQQIQGKPQLHSKFKAGLSYAAPQKSLILEEIIGILLESFIV